MLKTVVETQVISEEDKEELSRTWSDMKAMEELINSGIVIDLVMSEYKKAFKEYNTQWNKIFQIYFTTNYTNMQGYEWTCDFVTNIVTIKK